MRGSWPANAQRSNTAASPATFAAANTHKLSSQVSSRLRSCGSASNPGLATLDDITSRVSCGRLPGGTSHGTGSIKHAMYAMVSCCSPAHRSASHSSQRMSATASAVRRGSWGRMDASSAKYTDSSSSCSAAATRVAGDRAAGRICNCPAAGAAAWGHCRRGAARPLLHTRCIASG